MKKNEVNWITEAPQRNCSTCSNCERYGEYNEKFKCKEHGWTTKGKAVCNSYKQQ